MGSSLPPVILKETFGSKLRRLADKADGSNLAVNPPLILPPPWASATGYYPGQVVSSNGNWYQAVGTATSGGTAPTGTSPNTPVSDGSVAWTFIGEPSITSNSPLAPTLTTSQTSSLSNNWNAYTLPNLFSLYGCYSTSYFGIALQLQVFNQNASTKTTNGTKISFMTDAPIFDISINNSITTLVRVSVNGQYVTPGAIVTAAGVNPNFIHLDFSSAGGRIPQGRLISIEGPTVFYGVRTTSNDMVWAPSTQDNVRAIVISDSIVAGSSNGPFIPGNFIGPRLGSMLGWDDTWMFATGGTGYVASAGNYTYGQRIPEALTLNPDIWVFFGSTNDAGQTGVSSAIVSAMNAVRLGGSTSLIVVFGVWPASSGYTSNIPVVENTVSSAIASFVDPIGLTFFIPVCKDPNIPWITGAWNYTNNTNSSNSNIYICSDGTHPPDMGTMYLAERMARAIKSNVLPLLN